MTKSKILMMFLDDSPKYWSKIAEEGISKKFTRPGTLIAALAVKLLPTPVIT